MPRRLPRSGSTPHMITPTTQPSPAKTRSKTGSQLHAPGPSAATMTTPTLKAPSASTGSLKRKRVSPSAAQDSTSKPAVEVTTFDADDNESSAKATKKQKKKQEEKRSRIFRKKAPLSFLEKLERAQNQRQVFSKQHAQPILTVSRMIVIGRARKEHDGHPIEDIDIVGSTGNIYRVTIDKRPSCTCPDSKKGNECKHKVYALHTVLKAPENLVYQLGLLSTELREIFEGAPPIPTDADCAEDHDGKRKPIDGECPICYFDLDEKENELVWCKAACGNNMHKSCFEQWAASQRGQTVKCVYCRTPWEMDQEDAEKIKKTGQMNAEGYVNVADHFGMSSMRDYSSYHQPWVRRTLGMGW